MKKIFTPLALFSITCSLFAQTHNEQVTVIAPYQPTVLEAYKINVNPQTIDSSLKPREVRYDILSRKVMTSFGIDNIKPAKVAGEPISKLSPLYVRGGFGNYKTAYGELFYGSGRSSQWQYGAHLKHRSSQGTFKDYKVPFDNSDNLVELFSEYYGKKIILTKDFYYDRKRYSTYGADNNFLLYNPDFVKNEAYKRIYANTGGSLQISDNNSESNSLGYYAKLDLNAFRTNIEAKETSVAFSGNIHQTFDFNHPFFTQTIVGLDIAADWHKLNVDEFIYQQDDMLFNVPINNFKKWTFRPYGKLRFSGHDFSVGLRINTFDEFDAGNAQIKTALQLVPTIHAKFNLIDNLFAVEFGLDGNAEYLTAKKITEQNPFVLSTFYLADPLLKAQLHREYYLGLNTALSKTIDFTLKGKLVSYKKLLNFDAHYLSAYYGIWLSTTLMPFFTTIYQDINCFQLQADLNYYLNEKIAVSAQGRLNSYDDEILYKPKYEANLTARYNMQDKIILKTQFYFASEIYYRPVYQSFFGALLPDIEKYKPTVDWSLSAEYRFNKRWSAFLEFNNILNQRSQAWYNYGTYRMNFLTGITFNL